MMYFCYAISCILTDILNTTVHRHSVRASVLPEIWRQKTEFQDQLLERRQKSVREDGDGLAEGGQFRGGYVSSKVPKPRKPFVIRCVIRSSVHEFICSKIFLRKFYFQRILILLCLGKQYNCKQTLLFWNQIIMMRKVKITNSAQCYKSMQNTKLKKGQTRTPWNTKGGIGFACRAMIPFDHVIG